MKNRLLLILFVVAATLPVVAASKTETCPMVRIVPERLPDLTMPRCGHNIFYANGELTVTGGHTTNFVPTETAEYFSGGEWHTMTMAYPHDNGLAVVLKSGEVLIGGGHQEELGVGQTYTLERYTPLTHTFEGFGCLDRRRVLANATQLPDGRVIISGNHYAVDATACYDGRSQVQHLKDVAQERCNPYILPIAKDNALILSQNDQFNKHADSIVVERLKGDPIHVSLLQQWWPLCTDQPFSSDACSMGGYSYLLGATDESGQLGIVMVRDTTFSLLHTDQPIPMECPYGPIAYKAPLVVDSLHRRGYVIGFDIQCRHQYILAIDYDKEPAAVTLYYTDSIGHSTIAVPIVTPDGDLILAGGSPDNNYKPFASVWLYHFGTAPQTDASLSISHIPLLPVWLWMVIALAAVFAFAYLVFYCRRMNKAVADVPVTEKLPSDDKTSELMERICRLMDEEKTYLRSDLRLQDVAVRLSTNSSYVSECINGLCGQSFSQFVNTYRIRHAQELLRRQPDMKAAIVASESGFSTEASFFRNFKAVTGMTPREWLGSR